VKTRNVIEIIAMIMLLFKESDGSSQMRVFEKLSAKMEDMLNRCSHENKEKITKFLNTIICELCIVWRINNFIVKYSNVSTFRAPSCKTEFLWFCT
jgi:hypothetical protein